MMTATEQVMKGTVYETNWKIYHDALSLMTSAHARKYMADKGILHRWILPQNGLNKGTRFAYSPIGQQPGLMPLDTHINETNHQSADTHVQLSHSLPDNDVRKFSARTPKQLASVYLRLWDQCHGIDGGAVTSERIKQDVDRVIDETLLRIFYAHGCVVTTGSGRRRNATGVGRGGARKKKEFDANREEWIHPDVKFLKDEIIENAKKKLNMDNNLTRT